MHTYHWTFWVILSFPSLLCCLVEFEDSWDPRSQELNARTNTAPNSETQRQQRLNGFCFHWPTHIQLTLNSHSCFKDWTIATHYISVIFEEYLSCFGLSTPCAKCAMYFTLLTQFIVLTVRVAHCFEYEKSYTVKKAAEDYFLGNSVCIRCNSMSDLQYYNLHCLPFKSRCLSQQHFRNKHWQIVICHLSFSHLNLINYFYMEILPQDLSMFFH